MALWEGHGSSWMPDYVSIMNVLYLTGLPETRIKSDYLKDHLLKYVDLCVGIDEASAEVSHNYSTSL